MISYRPASEGDFEWAYSIKTKAERMYVEEHFGWNEPFQRKLHKREWQNAQPSIVCLNGERIGFYTLEYDQTTVYFRRFFIEKEHQNKGYGSRVVFHMLNTSKQTYSRCRLAVFHGNPAVRLYQRIGFIEIKRDNVFTYYEANF
jgi:GNAT superfamily N-acetyltransferase